MSENWIAYESMMIARESTKWTYWTMVAAWFSFAVSLCTLIFAAMALNSWKEQEKTKVKIQFKKEIFNFKHVITSAPDGFLFVVADFMKLRYKIDRYSTDPEKLIVLQSLDDIKTSWRNTSDAWVMCENILKKTDVHDLWGELSECYSGYIKDKKSQKDLLDVLSKVYESKFVF